jgi:hypothetical protein
MGPELIVVELPLLQPVVQLGILQVGRCVELL